MRASRAEVILHPQRLAILRALGTGPRTAKELARVLPDVPQAQLYRHLSTLAEAGFVETVGERAVRGTVERTYGLAGAAIATGEDLASATPEDHFRWFAAFLSTLLGEYGRYLEQDDIDLEADGVGYREHPLRLSDAELRDFLAELRGVIARWSDRPADPSRRARLLATITLPTTDPALTETPDD